jgi:hypothetical protein
LCALFRENRKRAHVVKTKIAGGLTVYLLEELSDARMRCAQLKRLISEATDLIEKSEHKDHFFEVAAHLIHDIPDNLLRLEKALDAAAMSASRMDYEEIKGNLKPEKAEELEQVLDDARVRLVRRRSGGIKTMSAKTVAEEIHRIARVAEEEGALPVGDLLVLVASLEHGVKKASSEETTARKLHKIADDLLAQKNPSRVALAKSLRGLIADVAQPTAGQMAASILYQANSREEVMQGFKSANPTLTEAQLEEIADHWERNKDVVKDKHTAATVSPIEKLEKKTWDWSLAQKEALTGFAKEASAAVKKVERLEDKVKLRAIEKKALEGVRTVLTIFGEVKTASDSKESEEKWSRFEEGTPADPTENMSKEDAQKWKSENEKNKDNFKSAASKGEVDERFLREMEGILKKHGYNPKDAKKLQAEGMGPEELEHRIKTTKPGGKGSLEYTHNLKRVKEAASDPSPSDWKLDADVE